MPMFQKFNKRLNAWVMFESYNGKTKIVNVKQRLPRIPFKGVKKLK